MHITYTANYYDFMNLFNSLSVDITQPFLEMLVDVSKKQQHENKRWVPVDDWGGKNIKPECDLNFLSCLIQKTNSLKRHSFIDFWVGGKRNILRMLYNLAFHYRNDDIGDDLRQTLYYFRTLDKHSKQTYTLDTFHLHLENDRVRHQGNYNEGKLYQKRIKDGYQTINYALMAILQTGVYSAKRDDLKDVMSGSDLYGQIGGAFVYTMELHHILFTNGTSHDKLYQPSNLFSNRPTKASISEMLKLVPLTPTSHKMIHIRYKSGGINIYNEWWDSNPKLKPYYLRNETTYKHALHMVLSKLKDEQNIVLYSDMFPTYDELILELSNITTVHYNVEDNDPLQD